MVMKTKFSFLVKQSVVLYFLYRKKQYSKITSSESKAIFRFFPPRNNGIMLAHDIPLLIKPPLNQHVAAKDTADQPTKERPEHQSH